MMPLRNSAPVENHFDLQLFTPVGCEEQMDMGGGATVEIQTPKIRSPAFWEVIFYRILNIIEYTSIKTKPVALDPLLWFEIV